MKLDFERTIVALSSPLAPGHRAIVRISGSRSKEVLQALLRADHGYVEINGSSPSNGLSKFLDSPTAVYRKAVADLDWDNRLLPVGVYYWPTSRSFTGQPSAELHFWGSLPLAQKVIERITQLGAYPAERGEFTLRSFLSGKLDLIQVEAVLGVIESVVGQQLEWALAQLGGNLSQPVKELRADLLHLLSDLEAGLDFAEEDIEFVSDDQIYRKLSEMNSRLERLAVKLDSRGTQVRPLEVVLVGLPNAGKSSLFNALLGKDRSITSDQSGTTRDAVSSALSLGEFGLLQVTLVDTAGMEELNQDSPRSLAQEVLRDRLSAADIAVLCVDLSNLPEPSWMQQQLSLYGRDGRTVICVGTKADLHQPQSNAQSRDTLELLHKAVSVFQPTSVDDLRRFIMKQCESKINQRFTEATHHTAIRFRHAIMRTQENLRRAQVLSETSQGHEIIASELHLALDELGSIIGEVHNDDILGQIFSRFCIGK